MTDLCSNTKCNQITNSNPDNFDGCLNRTCGKHICVDEMILYWCLQMAQQSCDPENYKGFVGAYNYMIDTRHFKLNKIGDLEWLKKK